MFLNSLSAEGNAQSEEIDMLWELSKQVIVNPSLSHLRLQGKFCGGDKKHHDFPGILKK
jgi:hypothetical protein